MDHELKKRRVGILGGGQLSLMLAQAAVRLGLKPIVFVEDSYAPAAQDHTEAVLGSVNDENDLRHFFSQVDLVIFENEFINCEIVEKVSQEKRIPCWPKLPVISQLQDKLNQKMLLDSLKIPTSPYRVLELSEDFSEAMVQSQIQQVQKEWGGSCVLKWARMGYDGKGVFFLSESLGASPSLYSFLRDGVKAQGRIYAEKWVPFERELAVIGVYSTQKEFLAYPLVVSEQKNGICHRVYGPADLFGVTPHVEKQAQEYAQKVAQAVGLTGAFALEFFMTRDAELLVNEIAPRVHNSGHYTQNACATDQFENHWRAVLGLPLGEVRPQAAFGMLNVLGPENSNLLENRPRFALPRPSRRSHVHWYGKRSLRAGRKMGHINGVASSGDEIRSLLNELDQCYREWVQQEKEVL